MVVTLISATPCPSISWKKSHAFPRCEESLNRLVLNTGLIEIQELDGLHGEKCRIIPLRFGLLGEGKMNISSVCSDEAFNKQFEVVHKHAKIRCK